jgi:hypothetical protein
MPHLQDGGFGAEYVRVIARLPQHLTRRELFRELATMPAALTSWPAQMSANGGSRFSPTSPARVRDDANSQPGNAD